jgi:predicted CopG family antitoxin
MEKIKTIAINTEMHRKLMVLKYSLGVKTISEVVEYLLNDRKLLKEEGIQ